MLRTNLPDHFLSPLNSYGFHICKHRVAETEEVVDCFQHISDFILGSDFSNKVYVAECYTSKVFPCHIHSLSTTEDCHAVFWNTHLWDLYGHFLLIYYEKIKNSDGRDLRYAETYFTSILFAFLSCRFFNEPVFSVELAKAYDSMLCKMPPYNEDDDIFGKIESLGLTSELTLAKLYVFAHEISHIAFRTNQENVNTLRTKYISFCQANIDFRDLIDQLNTQLNKEDEFQVSEEDERAFELSKHVVENQSDEWIEETCCDIMSILAIHEYNKYLLETNTSKTIASIDKLEVFFRFYWWLVSMEEFWGGLKAVHENPAKYDCAFVDSNSEYYNLGDKITAKLEQRTSMVVSFLGDYLGDNWGQNDLSDLDNVLKNAAGLSFIDQIMESILDEYYDQFERDIVRRTLEKKQSMMVAPELLGWGHKNPSTELEFMKADKEIRRIEAVKRLELLVKIYGLNPNVVPYFRNNKLYYSYLTGGGYIGSIDVISYDKRYELFAEQFENKVDCTVYHAIEDKDSLFLLYVSNNKTEWEKERPNEKGVFGVSFSWETKLSKIGYIQVDSLQGALYRRNNKIYTNLDCGDFSAKTVTPIDIEIINRLNLMIEAGLETDLDVIELYKSSKEIMLSTPMDIFGTKLGVIMRSSDNESVSIILKLIQKMELTPFFCVDFKKQGKLAILFVSPDEENWVTERAMLKNNSPFAIIINKKKRDVTIDQIHYSIVGGPIHKSDLR